MVFGVVWGIQYHPNYLLLGKHCVNMGNVVPTSPKIHQIEGLAFSPVIGHLDKMGQDPKTLTQGPHCGNLYTWTITKNYRWENYWMK